MQVEILKAIQSIHNPFFDVLFISITYLGSEFFYFAFIPYFYWNVDKRFGLKLSIMFLISVYLNTAIKELTSVIRPIGYPGIRSLALSTAGGYSFPSGHAQHSTVVWGMVASRFRSVKWYVIAVIFIVSVSFSRLYLGVHWPLDVIGGIVVGFALVYLSSKAKWLSTLRLSHEWLLWLGCVAVPLLLLLIFPQHDIWRVSGMMSGLLLGYFIESKYVRYEVGMNKGHKKIALYLMGISGLLLIYVGLDHVLPAELIFTWIKNFVMGVYITLIVPYFYKVVV